MVTKNEMPDKVIADAAERMKQMKEFTPPAWATFVKTGRNRERPPQHPDWWWIRVAAVLRKISVTGGMGVSRLRKEYGGRKNRGHKPEHKFRAGGSILRKAVQQLEAAGFVKKDKKLGRVITPQGMSFLNDSQKHSKGKPDEQ